jgi:triacylglycerol lipase
MLRESIEAALAGKKLQPKEAIHIIAHSMGGLDSRRMISKGYLIEANGEKTAIQTLATIGTPHRGSPVADLVILNFLNKIPP